MATSPSKLNVLLCWFHDDWGMYGRAYERVAEHLSMLPEVNKVVCMFPPASAHKYGIKGPLRIREVSQNLTLLTETDFKRFRLDRHFTRLRSWLNRIYRDRALKAYLRKLGFQADNTILWLFPPHPYIERLLDIIPRRGVVTHVIDDFTKFDPSHELYRYANAQYQKLGQWSDMIITTSKANQEHFAKTGRPCHMFWPAVDDTFIGVPGVLPHLAHGAPPHLGYVGWIMERTDLQLMEYIAIQRPQWKLTLVGPQHPDGILNRTGLLSLPNVEYRGPMPQKDVPTFLRSLDVCLMPHRDTEYSRSMGPLKLYQYLASGKPVVSTAVAGLDQVREHVRVASDYDEFVRHIEEALETDNPTLAAKRIDAARNQTWRLRVREIFDVVRSHLNQHSPATTKSSLPDNRHHAP